MGSVLSHIFETGKQRTLSPQFLAYFAVAAESRL
jgi:hypothetical protein